MSPPYDANPDRRPLPDGWIAQYDPNYKAWYYVNTLAKPPIPTWIHPLGPATPSLPEYSPPAVPPNNNSSTYADRYSPNGQGGYASQDDRNSSAEYRDERRGLGGLLGHLRPGHHHNSGFGRGGGGYMGGGGGYMGGGGGYMGGGGGYPGQQQQPQVVYVEQQHAPKRSGMGNVALGAGAGLLGGVVLGEMLERGDEDRRYDDGYNDGAYDGGFDGGNDFGGGDDFGSGDFF